MDIMTIKNQAKYDSFLYCVQQIVWLLFVSYSTMSNNISRLSLVERVKHLFQNFSSGNHFKIKASDQGPCCMELHGIPSRLTEDDVLKTDFWKD